MVCCSRKVMKNSNLTILGNLEYNAVHTYSRVISPQELCFAECYVNDRISGNPLPLIKTLFTV